MPDPSTLDFVTGAPATRRVKEDPFWSTVVRRHGFDGLDPMVASGALQRVQDLLAPDDAWSVLAPTDGIPRVLAGRPGRIGREDVQVLVPAAGRVVLRIRSELVVVGTAAVAESMGGGER